MELDLMTIGANSPRLASSASEVGAAFNGRFPHAFNPEIPSELERIIFKALEKDRDLRYQSAADLLTVTALRADPGARASPHSAHKGKPPEFRRLHLN